MSACSASKTKFWNLVLGDNNRGSHTNLISVQLPNITYTLLNTALFKLFFPCVLLGTANINACFQDTDLPGCFAGLHVWSLRTYRTTKRRCCGNIISCSCYFFNLTRTVRESLYLYSNNRTLPWYTLYKWFSLQFTTLKTIQ